MHESVEVPAGQMAISSASSARSVRSDRDACQPTMNREKASMMKAT
jgi:hypothetical protein